MGLFGEKYEDSDFVKAVAREILNECNDLTNPLYLGSLTLFRNNFMMVRYEIDSMGNQRKETAVVKDITYKELGFTDIKGKIYKFGDALYPLIRSEFHHHEVLSKYRTTDKIMDIYERNPYEVNGVLVKARG